MKRGVLLLSSALLVAVLSASFSVVSADSNGAIVCLTDIVYDEHDPIDEPGVYYWYGPVYGCELEGFLRYDPDEDNEPFFPGNSYHWFEKFTISPSSGGEIRGNNAGTVQWANYKFRANGWVTDASSEWAHMIGNKYFEMGTVSESPVPPFFAPGTLMRIAPAKNRR
jgi:hypothetical protein